MIVSCEIGPEEIKVFMEEAEEHLQLLDQNIIRLESEGANRQLLQEIFRSAHTLKGSSAMLGHERMAEVTHAMESLLDKLRDRKISVNSGIIDSLLYGLDALKVLKSEVMSRKEGDVDIRAVVSYLAEAEKTSEETRDGCGAGQANRGQECEGRQLPKWRREIAGKEVRILDAQSTDNRPGMTATNRNSKLDALRVRVDVAVLDNLMVMAESLLVDRSHIGRIGQMLRRKYPEDELVRDLVDKSSHVITAVDELCRDIIRVRTIPIGLLFGKFRRLVRDTAKKLHKKLDFVIEGEDTELDRAIAERIQDPLVHLLRNAVDHGIESREVRRANGKREKALIRLSACQKDGRVVVKVEDDGSGIDPHKVRESAVRSGFLSAEAVGRLTDSEVIGLLFLPGMSTAERTTVVSGRGVGLDIVRTSIERLNGKVTLETREGKGTTFTINLPLTAAQFQAVH